MKFIFVSGHTFDLIPFEDAPGTDSEIIFKPLQPSELLSKIRGLLHII